MLPSVALARPEDLLPILEVAPVILSVIVLISLQGFVIDEGGTGFVDQRMGLAVVRVDLNHSVTLVSALVVLEDEAARILPPLDRLHVELIGEQGRINFELLAIAHIEEH